MTNISTGIGLVLLVTAGLAGCAVVTPEASTAPTQQAEEPAEELVIDGLYEVTITQDELVAAGVTDPASLAEHAGTYYWTFDNGTWVYEQISDEPLDTPGSIGTYTIDADLYTHHWSDAEGDVTTATVAVAVDGTLQFSDIVDGDPAFQQISEVLFGLHPWVRIGES